MRCRGHSAVGRINLEICYVWPGNRWWRGGKRKERPWLACGRVDSGGLHRARRAGSLPGEGQRRWEECRGIEGPGVATYLNALRRPGRIVGDGNCPATVVRTCRLIYHVDGAHRAGSYARTAIVILGD